MSRQERAPTMMDVASRAAVSHQTVSRVLAGSEAVAPATRERVLAAVEALGYRRNAAARALARRRSGTIGVLVGGLDHFGPSRMVVGVDAAARAAGFSILLAAQDDPSPAQIAEGVGHLLDQAVEAVVVIATHADAAERALGAVEVPLVVLDGTPREGRYAIGLDQLAGAVLATSHLVDLGHRRIAHVRGPLGWTQADARLTGWREVLASTPGASGNLLRGDWTARSGYAAGRALLGHPEVTGVFVANDQMALGLIRALTEAGRRVPEDVSVVGFDDVPEAAFYAPPLTSVRQDFGALGQAAIELAVGALSGRGGAASSLVMPELVVRQSTGPAPG